MEVATFKRAIAVVRAQLCDYPPQQVHLVLEVQAVAPLTLRDADGFSFVQLNDSIESMIQDFSFLKVN